MAILIVMESAPYSWGFPHGHVINVPPQSIEVFPMRRIVLWAAWFAIEGISFAGGPAVTLSKTPARGIQPQAVLDAKGSLHLLYFQGEAKGGDLMYVRREAGKFSQPQRVNSRDGSAIATGTIRGGHLAI